MGGVRRTGPSAGAGPGGEHEELLKALDSRAKNSVRGVAKDLFGADKTADWDPDGGTRSKARRRIDKATALMEGGYRTFLEPGAKRGRRSRKPQPGKR